VGGRAAAFLREPEITDARLVCGRFAGFSGKPLFSEKPSVFSGIRFEFCLGFGNPGCGASLIVCGVLGGGFHIPDLISLVWNFTGFYWILPDFTGRGFFRRYF
jgi:hypothetical protein